MREFWKDCKKNITYFGLPFFGGLSAIFLSIFNALAYSYWWFFGLLPGLILTFKMFPLLKSLAVSKRVNNEKYGVVRLHNYTILKFGQARSGKTLTAVNEAIVTSQVLWSDLSLKYETMSKRQHLFDNYNDEKFILDFDEVERAYKFWSERPWLIPCLLSNIKIEFDGRYSVDLTIEHLGQDKWIPAFSVLLVDEIGRFLGVEKSKFKEEKINDFVCWIGQFCECHLIATEQRPTNVMIDLRGVLGVNEQILSMKKSSQADLLFRILDKLDSFAIRQAWSAEAFELLHKIRAWGDRVGFITFEIETMGNLDFGTGDRIVRTVTILADTKFKYESRCFRTLWLAKDFDDKNCCSGSMFVDPVGELAQSIYSRYEDKDEEKTYKKKKYYPF